MRLPFKVGSMRTGCSLALVIVYIASHSCGRCSDDGANWNPADPAIGDVQMEDLSIVPVPSVRAALASNPSISDRLLEGLVDDRYDSVHLAALAAWNARHPAGRNPRRWQRDAGTKLASPDYVELREMIYHDQGLQAALAWRSLPRDLRSNLLGVCTLTKETDTFGPLLDFVVMAEPPGGPLASSIFSQLLSQDPKEISEMRSRGLLFGIHTYGMYAQAIAVRNRKFIKLLADSGLPPNDRGEGGETPLMAAASTGDVETILLLMSLGAEADAKDDESLTASDYACNSLKVDAAEVLALNPDQRAKADRLKERFTPASSDSKWIGWWTAVDHGAQPSAFPTLIFGRDGTFDMPSGPAGSWYEVDPNNVVATPMLKSGTKGRAARTLYGRMDFQRLENPTRVQVKFQGEALEFQPKPDSSDLSIDATTLALGSAMNPAASAVAAPTGLKAKATLEKVALSWDAVPGAAGYFIYRDGTLLSSEFVTAPAYIDDAPTAAPSVTYEVQTVGDIHHLSLLSAHLTVAPVLADTDGKGLPDRWQMLHFGHLGVDPNADPDGNGLTYLEKYKKGFDPKDYYNGVVPVCVSPMDGKAGPDDSLSIFVKHPDGTPWRNAPVSFDVKTGSRLLSALKDTPPYVANIDLRTDETGFAKCYLQPFPKP